MSHPTQWVYHVAALELPNIDASSLRKGGLKMHESFFCVAWLYHRIYFSVVCGVDVVAAPSSPPWSQVWSWGWNDRGTLGLGHRAKARKPQRLAALGGVRIVQVGLMHACGGCLPASALQTPTYLVVVCPSAMITIIILLSVLPREVPCTRVPPQTC
jgi:hypothetical protein